MCQHDMNWNLEFNFICAKKKKKKPWIQPLQVPMEWYTYHALVGRIFLQLLTLKHQRFSKIHWKPSPSGWVWRLRVKQECHQSNQDSQSSTCLQYKNIISIDPIFEEVANMHSITSPSKMQCPSFQALTWHSQSTNILLWRLCSL